VIKMTHYLYVLSSWSLVAEDAVSEVCRRFGDRLDYDWRIAITDYQGNGPFKREQLEFFYARLEAATGRRMNLGWWREGYDWLVPDRVVAAARSLGATGIEVRLAIARAGLCDGEDITNPSVAIDIACRVSGIARASLQTALNAPETLLWLAESARQFQASGVTLRPAFVLENDLGDRAILSGIWNTEPLSAAITALLTDEESYHSFVASRAPAH
jgi:predicted DsbA family dithiol-disulfide isomerase